jgi:hypothetical protein
MIESVDRLLAGMRRTTAIVSGFSAAMFAVSSWFASSGGAHVAAVLLGMSAGGQAVGCAIALYDLRRARTIQSPVERYKDSVIRAASELEERPS